jgi:glucose-1-phosphate thymidylyltransferase
MIYYSLSTLLLVGIREIVLVTNRDDVGTFRSLFETIGELGVTMHFVVQDDPNGVAEALILSEDFIGDRDSMLVLGDNIIYGAGFQGILKEACNNPGATIFGYPIKDPSRFGVLEIDGDTIRSLEEKPVNPKSNLAIPGIYLYDHRAVQFAKNLFKSDRGELEITSLNRLYLEDGSLHYVKMGRGTSWFDTGTPESMLAASNFVHSVETSQGLMIACLEEIALSVGLISKEDFCRLVDRRQTQNDEYNNYIRGLLTV